MNEMQVVAGQYNKTILALHDRLVTAALELAAAVEKIEEQAKELEELKKPKDAPKLEAVKDSA